ncbi:Methyltransferase [Phytophthora megakarya]|uniref:tRNA N(3)-methylcytidine methyltransferase n=1 Tax=Phytophthora megakarya TaxID=4795 RepID=A0A225WIX4_9STRA|nr:Methyltransferase [Phytophthora megakarya]
MSGNKNPTNLKLEELVEKAGVSKHVLEDPERVVCDDVWTEERERLAQEHLKQDKSTIPEFWQKKYEKEAAKSWDKFYKRNSTNFYKDRHYLHLVFQDLGEIPETGETRTLLEVGSGVGNAALPLLEVNPALNIVAIDFADSAIELLKKQPLYDEARVAASVCDITNDALPDAAFANGGVDFALFLFCLSALHPDKMKDAVKKVVAAIKPGGKLFFRDYGRYDQASLEASCFSATTADMIRLSFDSALGASCKKISTFVKTTHARTTLPQRRWSRFSPKLDWSQWKTSMQENFYVRQDNTRAYYFTTEEVEQIFTEAGLVPVENEYIRRQYANRQQNVVRFRVWVHAIFEKPVTATDATQT